MPAASMHQDSSRSSTLPLNVVMDGLWRSCSLLSHASLLALLITLCTLWPVPPVHGQFPRVCASNATKPGARCCPAPPGTNQPCGGPGRGACLAFERVHEYFWPPLTNHLRDDRINWPVAFFKYGCACVENFAGYMCQDCKWGYRGPNCTERYVRKRRNLLTMTKAEQQRFINLVDRSKYEISEYVALASNETDPIKNPQWVNITVHNFIIYIHFYSARSTFFNDTSPCEFTPFHLDFSHEGSGFPTFHRLLMLVWEREFQKLAKDDTFSFPYWDWSDDGTNCPVCTNELMGALTPDGTIHPGSRFSKWKTVCHHIEYKQCRVCNPRVTTGRIIRRPGTMPGMHRLPSEAQVDYTLSLPKYDVPPFDESSDPAFRSCFEGACPDPDMNMSMHGLVHAFFNGSLSDVATSTNDPIFILHHTFLDKLLELWLRKHKPHSTQFPPRGAPIGHNRDAVMVPFFPRHFHRWYFADSRGMGYDYDNFNYGKSGKIKFDESAGLNLPGPPAPPRSPTAMMTTVIGAPLVIFAFLTVLVIHDRFNKSAASNERTRPAAINGKPPGPAYTIVSDTDDDNIIFCDKAKNCVVGEMYPEKEPLIDDNLPDK